jgi:metacaspase-1
LYKWKPGARFAERKFLDTLSCYTMAKGFSLHIGVNKVNPLHYKSEYPLKWCCEDAKAMRQLAAELRYETRILLNEQATTDNFFANLNEAKQLGPDDVFLLTFAGHGTRCPDFNSDEKDVQDEAWALYDRMLLDDEAGREWKKFNPRVRIVIVTDCCFSGLFFDKAKKQQHTGMNTDSRIRSIQPHHAGEVLKQHWHIYKEIVGRRDMEKRKKGDPPCLLQLSACCVDEPAHERGEFQHGVFTHTLLKVWNTGRFSSYTNFHKMIMNEIPSTSQTPDLQIWGPDCTFFRKQKPFSI